MERERERCMHSYIRTCVHTHVCTHVHTRVRVHEMFAVEVCVDCPFYFAEPYHQQYLAKPRSRRAKLGSMVWITWSTCVCIYIEREIRIY